MENKTKQPEEYEEYEKHVQRHDELHLMLDELIADYLYHNTGSLMSDTTIMELLIWSYRQTINPEQIKK